MCQENSRNMRKLVDMQSGSELFFLGFLIACAVVGGTLCRYRILWLPTRITTSQPRLAARSQTTRSYDVIPTSSIQEYQLRAFFREWV